MKADVFNEQNTVRTAMERIVESMGAFNVSVRLSGADMNAIPGTLTYELEDVPVETKKGSAVVPSAGTLSLNIGTEELAERVFEKTNGKVDEIVDIRVTQPPSDFKYGNNISEYTVSVFYVTEDGDNGSVELEFDNIGFSPSEQFFEQLRNLT
jgi:hypothetical protein